MDFRKSSGGLLGASVWIALGCAGICVFVEAVTGETGVRIPYFLVLAPVAVVIGLVKLIRSLLRSLTVRIDERGILIHHSAQRAKVELGWQYVAAVSVTQLPTPKDPRSTATYLAVWTQGGVNPGRAAGVGVPQRRLDRVPADRARRHPRELRAGHAGAAALRGAGAALRLTRRSGPGWAAVRRSARCPGVGWRGSGPRRGR